MSFTNKDLENLRFMIDLGFEPYNFDKKADGIWYLRNYKNTVQKIVIGKDRGTMDLMIDFGSYHCQYEPDCHYDTKEDVERIFSLFKKVITNDLDRYDSEDHVTGYINEDIYYNYQEIADSIDFKPKNIDELNKYALKVLDEKRLSFDNYIKQISSLYIVMLLDVYGLFEIDFSYDKNEKYNYRRIFAKKISSHQGIKKNEQDEEEVIIQPTLDVEKLWNGKIDVIYHKIFEKDETSLNNTIISVIKDKFRNIADSVGFKPRNINELNEFAIKLRDNEKLTFEEYVKQISSLYMVLLLDIYGFSKAEHFHDPKEILFLKIPPYAHIFENSIKYWDDFTRIQIMDDVIKLYYKHKGKLGYNNLKN